MFSIHILHSEYTHQENHESIFTVLGVFETMNMPRKRIKVPQVFTVSHMDAQARGPTTESLSRADGTCV